MRVRDSGMPDQDTWEGFFDPEATLARLGLTPACGDVVEFGCGYGTFTIAAARVAGGTVHALDIDPQMIAATARRAEASGLPNVRAVLRDFMDEGTGLADRSADFAMVFNILHAGSPDILLAEAFRVLREAGLLAIVHWNHDAATPRGPDLSIRPQPNACRRWAVDAGFDDGGASTVNLPPHHWGITVRRPPGTPGAS